MVETEDENAENYVDIMQPFVNNGIENFKIIATSRQTEMKNFDSFLSKFANKCS